MSETVRKPASAWRVSLRELLMILAFVAVTCAAMVHPMQHWVSILTALVMITGGFAAIQACVERGHRQAFGVGFAIAMVLYLIGARLTPSPTPVEANKSIVRMNESTSLPTSKLLAYLWRHTRRPYYFGIYNLGHSVGVPLEAYKGKLEGDSIPKMSDPFGKRPTPPSSYGQPGGPVQYYVGMFPDLQTTLRVGHQLFTIFFGYLGGKFAMWIYLRRLAREAKEQS